MLLSMRLNVGLCVGECLVKSIDPNRIKSTRVGELLIDAGGADEASVPAPQIPTDGANEEGVTSIIPMSRDPGFREGRRRWWTTRLDRTRGTIYPGSGPFKEGKTPTPICMIDYSAICCYKGCGTDKI